MRARGTRAGVVRRAASLERGHLRRARMLDAGRLDETAIRRATEAILRNAIAQVQLIEGLFDVSRVITGNVSLDVRPLDIQAVLEAALDSVRPTAAAKGVHLEAILDPHAGALMGDPARLQQVVWNLLSNAVKFTPKGGRADVASLAGRTE